MVSYPIELMREVEKRKKVRDALIGQGFKRIDYTQASEPDENGITKYSETWERPDAKITLEWT